MPPHVHLIRHAQGYHQLESTLTNGNLPDPSLTPLGVTRCNNLSPTLHESLHPSLICASPLRRAIQTAQHLFSTGPRPILLLPDAQEATDVPSDTGSSREAIEGEFGDEIDASRLEDGWNSNEGKYGAGKEALAERARRLRAWLRERPEMDVVVIGHGNFWHWATGEVDDDGNQTSRFCHRGFILLFFGGRIEMLRCGDSCAGWPSGY